VIHGELLEIFGIGVLITGNSGIGKSELALKLISRGHRLISDDIPTLAHVLEGTCPSALHDFLEVLGLGVLNIRKMFGDRAIKCREKVLFIIELVKMENAQSTAESLLLGVRDDKIVIDVRIPAIKLPITLGRNLAVLTECAVRDHVLRMNGYLAEEDLIARIKEAMADSR
jgi:HPr kinase/phosphorylase